MSYDYWWLLGFVTENQVSEFGSRFAQAETAARAETKHSEVYDAWYENSLSTSELIKGSDGKVPPDASHFNWYFAKDAYKQLGKELLAGKISTLTIDDSTVFRFITMSSVVPTSLLYFCLGPEKVKHMPGYLGNMLISRKRLHEVAPLIRNIVASCEHDACALTVKRYLEVAGDYRKKDVDEVITSLAAVASAAELRKCGFFSLAMGSI